LVPDQLPPAVHELGVPVADHVIVELPPVVRLAGDAEIVTTGTAITVTEVDFVSEPALLLQLSVYVYVPAVLMTPVLVLPLPALEPDQLPLAVQAVGLFVADQLIVELPPVPILVGDAEIVITGGETGATPELTDTEVVALLLPPAFEQAKVYVYVLTVLSVPVLAGPFVAFAPDQSPLAVQAVGLFVADHDSVELPPAVIAIGLALKLTTGAGGNVTLTVAERVALCPDVFVHTILYVYTLAVFRIPVLTFVPLAAFAPAQSPPAEHGVAPAPLVLVEDQLSTALLPTNMLEGLAVIEASGGGKTTPIETISNVSPPALPQVNL